MSVILTNMDMPISCYECRLKTRCEYAMANGWLGNKRDDNCPLEPYEERYTGKWVVLHDEYGDVVEAVCSLCDMNGNHTWQYCPYCGAKMEGAENE